MKNSQSYLCLSVWALVAAILWWTSYNARKTDDVTMRVRRMEELIRATEDRSRPLFFKDAWICEP